MYSDNTTTDPIPTKTCTKCGEVKPRSEFNIDRQRKDGLFVHCRDCYRAYQAERRATSHGKELAKKYNKKWYDNGGKEVYAEYHKQERVKKKKTEYAKSEKGKKSRLQSMRKRRSLSPNKYKANNAVNNAVRDGRLPHISTQTCLSCGGPAVEYHHRSYRREHWLVVTPLCKECHTATYTNSRPNKKGED